MSVGAYVNVIIDATFRDDQNAEDRFQLIITTARTGHWGDPWWLNEQEIRDFRDKLTAALDAHAAATEKLNPSTPLLSLEELTERTWTSMNADRSRPLPEAEKELVRQVATEAIRHISDLRKLADA